MKKVIKALAILSSFSILTRALGFVFRIFLSRTIGAEGLGIYQIAFSVFMVLETIVSSGLPLVVSKQTASKDSLGDKKGEQGVVSAGLVIGISTSLLLCGVVYTFKALFGAIFTDKRCLGILFILMPTLVFSSVYAVLRGNLWGKKKFFWVSFTEFIEQIVRVILSVLFLVVIDLALEKVFLASIAYAISCLLSSILVFFIYIKSGGKFSSPKGQFAPLLKSSSPITLVRVISSLITPFIAIIIPLRLASIGYTNEQAIALFGIAIGMTFPLLYIPSTVMGALSMTLIPNISSAVTTQKYGEVKSHINFSIKFAYFISFLFISLYMALGEHIGVFFYNNLEAGVFLVSSSVLVLPICLSGVTISCLNALDMETKTFINYAVGAVLLTFSITILPDLVGIMSLVWGMGLCLGSASVLNIFMIGKRMRDNFFNIKYLGLSILSGVPAFLIAKWSFGLMPNNLPLFVMLAISCSIGAIFYFASGLIFGLYDLSFLKLKKKKTANNAR